MSSLKQIEANRRNALKSTGPITSEGKERSRRNATRHGLTAETVIEPIENAEEYETFEATVVSDYDAETAVERQLVLRLASVLWRLRRATGIETALFESATAESGKRERGHSRLCLVGHPDLQEHDQLFRVAATPSKTTTTNEHAIDAEGDIAQRFMRLMALTTLPLDRLNRYEYVLWRQARQITFTLDSIRRRKWSSSRPRPPFSYHRANQT